MTSIPKSKQSTRPNNNEVRFVTLAEALGNYFKGYLDWRGTSTRAEYWWMVLLVLMLSVFPPLLIILVPVMIIPDTMLKIRRMHDIGKSGWYYYGIQFAGLAASGIFSGLSWRLMDKETIFMKLGDGSVADITMASNTHASIFAGDMSVIVVLALAVYLLYLLAQPSKVIGNKYRK
jgi:uncharacterized membrane protein YhaH (DUF805 family)